MNLDGNWVSICDRDESHPIVISGDNISFTKTDANGNVKPETWKYILREDFGYLEDFTGFSLFLEGDSNRSYDYMVHEETVQGKTILMLSRMIMEFDGRGRIVGGTLVRKEDLELVDAHYESQAYKRLNRRPAPPMQNVGGFTMPPMHMMGSGTMTMQDFMNRGVKNE